MYTLDTFQVGKKTRRGKPLPPGEAPPRERVLGFAIKLAQAFLFNDAVVGIRGDVDRLRELEAALLEVPA